MSLQLKTMKNKRINSNSHKFHQYFLEIFIYITFICLDPRKNVGILPLVFFLCTKHCFILGGLGLWAWDFRPTSDRPKPIQLGLLGLGFLPGWGPGIIGLGAGPDPKIGLSWACIWAIGPDFQPIQPQLTFAYLQALVIINVTFHLFMRFRGWLIANI